jgi:hypothetical protein
MIFPYLLDLDATQSTAAVSNDNPLQAIDYRGAKLDQVSSFAHNLGRNSKLMTCRRLNANYINDGLLLNPFLE